MSTMNLLPKDYQQQRSRQRANILCMILFVLVMIGVGIAAWVGESNADAMRQANEEVSQEYRLAAESVAQIRRLEAQKKQVIAKAKMAAELLERVPRSYLLACLTNALPEGASLTRVSLKTRIVKAAQPAPKPKTKFRARASRSGSRQQGEGEDAAPERPKLQVSLEVTGLARTDVEVAQFISNMQDNPLLRSVELVYSLEKQIEEEMLREFRVTMDLAPNAEAPADQGPPAATEAVTTLWNGRSY